MNSNTDVSAVEYRGYFFVNANYMKEVQWGIQSSHTVADMFCQYLDDSGESVTFQDLAFQKLIKWGRYNKTIILLNGGNHSQLNDIYEKLEHWSLALNLPRVKFKEDSVSLNEATTCVGIVIPNTVYNLVTTECYFDGYGCQKDDIITSAKPIDTAEQQLKDFIAKYPLAR